MIGPSLSLVDCSDGLMTLKITDAEVGSTVVVLGSIHVPQGQQTDQLVLLSNTQCPVIDVMVKMPKQHHSKDLLKTKVVEIPSQPSSGGYLVKLGNPSGGACADFAYQAADMTNCVAGPVLDLRQ